MDAHSLMDVWMYVLRVRGGHKLTFFQMDFGRVEAHSLLVEVEVARRVADSEVHAGSYSSDREVDVEVDDGRWSALVYPHRVDRSQCSLVSTWMQWGLLVLAREELICIYSAIGISS